MTFLFLLQNKDCENSLEPPKYCPNEAVLTRTHNLFSSKIRKIKFIQTLSFFQSFSFSATDRSKAVVLV